jgi:hypothetical protein
MILPTVHGNIQQKDFFIFTACDTVYFDEFGKNLINSVLKNTTVGIHIHIFNPREDQIEFCQKNLRISCSYEHVLPDAFIDAANKWSIEPTDPKEKLKYDRIKNSMVKGGDHSLVDRIQKTYFACARFIRLETLTKIGDKFFAMDVDAVVRKNIPQLSADKDCHLFKITGKKARVLAGGMYFSGSARGYEFIKEYASELQKNLETDHIYWSLDQDVLDPIVPKYATGDLPSTLIDWEMQPNSIVWTAKGARKDMPAFIAEKKKYNS